jgi:hypothetical protein
MNRPVHPVVLVACAVAFAACGPSPSASRDSAADSVRAGLPAAAAPATCGSGPLDSALALRSRGGGCTPFDLGAVNALNATLAGDTSQLFKGLEQLSAVDPEWAPVVNGGAGPASTPVLLHGTVLDSHISTTDFPSTHVTIDQNTDILLDEDDAGCAATGNATAELGDVGRIGEPHIELEWEVGSYPAFAWAGPGDRIVALGRWVFDCGHEDAVPGACRGSPATACILDSDCAAGDVCAGTVFNYHSELHPPQAVAVIRSGRGAPMPKPQDQAELKPIPVTRADVFVSGDGGGAGDACVLSPVPLPALLGLGGVTPQNCFPFSAPLAPINDFDFEFDVPLPNVPRAGVPFWQIEAQADHAPAVSADVRVVPVVGDASSPHLHVTVLMTKPVGGALPTGFAGTLFAGWRRANAPHLRHVRVTIEGIEIRDPLAHLIPVPNPHAWRAEASVNGEWQKVIPDLDVAVASFPHFFPLNLVYDQWLRPDLTLAVHAQAESEGCEDLVRGNSIAGIINGLFGGNIVAGAACDADTEDDTAIHDDEIDATFPGPNFGVQAASHVVESDKGVWALRFRIERAEGED